jgi:hypothetical protein
MSHCAWQHCLSPCFLTCLLSSSSIHYWPMKSQTITVEWSISPFKSVNFCLK